MDTKQEPHREINQSSQTTSQTFQDAEGLVFLSDEQYAAQFKQMDREALATILAAVVITCVFWGTIFIFHDIQVNILHMPLWFVLSCIGGYLFSVVVVLVLVKKFMRHLELKVSSISEMQEVQEEQEVQNQASTCAEDATSQAKAQAQTVQHQAIKE